MYSKKSHWSARTKLTVVLLVLALGLYLLYRFEAALKPSIVAALLAYGLSPLANFFQEHLKFRRGLATLLAYLLLLICVVVALMIFIPPLVSQVTALNLDLKRSLGTIEGLLGRQYSLFGQTIDGEAIFQQVIASVQGLIEPVVGQTLSFAFEALSSLVWLIFILMVSFYLVKDGGMLRRWFDSVTPPVYKEDFRRLRAEINDIWSAFFRGQLTLALIVASAFTLIGLIVGLPFALVMGVLAGILEFLPSIGHGIWLSIASLLALFIGSTWIPLPNWAFTLLIVGMHIFFQQFDLNYLIPRVIGRRVHLPPLVVILGIVTGALLAGVLGILLAAPTIASMRVLGRYIYANLFDQDPFPGTIASPLPPPNPRWWRKATPIPSPLSEQVAGGPNVKDISDQEKRAGVLHQK
jgi:predicted PurR-regulated permease PerM